MAFIFAMPLIFRFASPIRRGPSLLLLGLLPIIAAGCAKQPPPVLGVPPVSLRAGHFLGSPLTGPITKALPDHKPEEALGVTVTWVALERVPAEPIRSLASQARIVAVTRSGLPVQAAARMAQSGRMADADEAAKFRAEVESPKPTAPFGRTAPISALSGALPIGVTARFEAAEAAEPSRFVAGELVRRHVEVQLYRPDATNALQVAVALEDLVLPASPIIDTTPDPAEGSGDSGGMFEHGLFGAINPFKSKPSKPAAAVTQPATRPAPIEHPATQPPPTPFPLRELVLFDRPAFAGREAFALMLPYRFGNSESRALAVFIEVTEGSADAAHLSTYETCMADLKESLARAAARPYLENIDNPEWPGLRSALDAMAKPNTPRAPMVFLGGQTGVTIFEDIAMVADDETRKALSAKVFATLGAPAKINTKPALAWILEHCSYELLSEQSSGEKLASELKSLLAVYAGEAGRHAGALDEALKTSKSRVDFELRVIAENYIYLEDSSPASRVRAYDWLRAHDRAPAGYDPLGPPKERRAALERALTPAPPTAAPAPAIAPGGVR